MKKQVFMACLAAVAGASAGTATYSFSWYRNAPVTDFPVPLVLEEGRNGFTYSGSATGGVDLRATDGNGANLPLEIESWNPGGRSVVWVKVPNLSDATTVTLSWGDASAATADASGMWADSMAVLHFGDAPGLNSAHGDTLSPVGNAATIAGGRAPVGDGALFDRTADYRTVDASSADYWPETTNQLTISFWLRADKLTKANDQTYLCQWGQFTNKARNEAYQMAILLNWYVNAGIDFFVSSTGSGGPHFSGSASWPRITFPGDGDWHHVAYTSDGTTTTAYLDGRVVDTGASDNFSITAWGQEGGYLSVGGTRNFQHPLDGMMDEFRFERVCRSADWIRAAVETQARSFHTATIPFSDYTGEALTDFPAYVHVDRNMGVDPGLLYKGLTNGTAQVMDLRTGALLPVEIEYAFDNAFDKSLGMWVKMPSYSAADGVVVMAPLAHYRPDGAAASGSAVGSSGVWNDDFLLVFHMNPTGYLHDVKSRVRLKPNWAHNQGECANAFPVAVDGPTGPYQAYWSTTNSIQTVKPTINHALTNVYTVSWWAKEDEDEFLNPKRETYGWTLLGTSLLKGAGYSGNGTGPNRMAIWQGVKTATLDIPDAGWHQYAYASDGAKTYCYRDGALMTSASGAKNFGFGTSISGQPIHLMGSSNATKDAFRGKTDEVRLETVCRSADWIKAAYQNQLAWRDGTPWQFAPHFADAVTASVTAGGALTAQATLSCRTNATVTAYWGRVDGGTDAARWANAIALGTKADGAVTASATLPVAGARYAVRFRAVNAFGEAWSPVRYVTVPVASARGASVAIAVNYAGGETLVNFPLCVRIPASNGLPADPGKVRIVDEGGTPLVWEAETWDPSGESVLWVRVPTLTGTTQLTLAFHDDFPNDDGAWAAESVWPGNEYAGVWHFAASTKSGVYTEDSTAFGADMNYRARDVYPTNGVLGTAYHFPTNTAGLFRASDGTPFNDFGEGFTFSFWAAIPDRTSKGERDWSGAADKDWQDFAKHELKNRPADISYVQYVVRYDAAAEGVVDLFPYCAGNRIVPPGLNNNYLSEDKRTTNNTSTAFSKVCRAAKPDEGWHHYAFTHDGMFLAAYLDGTLLRRQFWPLVLNTAVQDFKVMQTGFGSNSLSATNGKQAKGTLDEYRAERVGRSAAWIKACYDNQKPGSTFVTVGSTRYPGTILIFR